jgi:hypothetical protein
MGVPCVRISSILGLFVSSFVDLLPLTFSFRFSVSTSCPVFFPNSIGCVHPSIRLSNVSVLPTCLSLSVSACLCMYPSYSVAMHALLLSRMQSISITVCNYCLYCKFLFILVFIKLLSGKNLVPSLPACPSVRPPIHPFMFVKFECVCLYVCMYIYIYIYIYICVWCVYVCKLCWSVYLAILTYLWRQRYDIQSQFPWNCPVDTAVTLVPQLPLEPFHVQKTT